MFTRYNWLFKFGFASRLAAENVLRSIAVINAAVIYLFFIFLIFTRQTKNRLKSRFG